MELRREARLALVVPDLHHQVLVRTRRLIKSEQIVYLVVTVAGVWLPNANMRSCVVVYHHHPVNALHI